MARGGRGYDAEVIAGAVEDSLRRLRTDVIDLYQLHWPMRGSYMSGQNWAMTLPRQNRPATLAHMDEVLGALAREVEKGRIRAFGLSNETDWGTTR